MNKVANKEKKSQLRKIIDITTPSQMFCLGITLILLGYVPSLIKGANKTLRYRKLERPDYNHESLEDFWIVIPMSIVLRSLKEIINYSTYNFFKGKLGNKYSPEELEKKIKKCSRGLFKVLYFSFTFIFGLFYVLNTTHFSPPTMFGSGELKTCFGDWPFTPMPDTLKFYYLLSFSYYVEDGIVHLFLPPNYDYWEMVLHHVITAMLIFSSYMNGFWNIGIFVLVQMDFEDIPIGMIRVVMDYASIPTIAVLYLTIMISWIYFRFFAFFY